MSQAPRPSWWQTVPGALTAAAAVITAFTGLLLALGELGVLGRGGDPEAGASGPAAEAPTRDGRAGAPPAGPAASTSPASPAPELVPDVSVAALGEHRYELMRVATQARNPGDYLLRVEVRLWNDGRYDANFWDATFRLRVDGVPRPPVGGLNEVVRGNAAAEGAVEFVVPRGATDLVLLLLGREETVEIPLRRAGA